MSSLPGANLPPSVQAIPSAPPVTRSNPDRQRREQQHQPHHEEHKREQDSADLTHHEEPKKGTPPAAHIKPPTPDEHPHIDVQG